MDKREKKGIELKAKPRKLVKQLALALGLGMSLSGAWANNVSCNTTLYYCGNLLIGNDNVTINTTDAAGGNPLKGYGIYMNDVKYTLNDVTINTSGSKADGIFSIGNNNVGRFFIANGQVNIKTTGAGSDGINLGTRGGPGASTGASHNTAILSAAGGVIEANGVGVRANNNLGTGAKTTIFLGDNYTIKQTGTSVDNKREALGYAVYAGNRDEDISGFGTMDILRGHKNNSKGDSYVFIGDNVTISSAGKSNASYKAAAVYANKGGVIQLGDNATITAPQGAYALYASTEKQVLGPNNVSETAEERAGTILLKGGATLNAGGLVTDTAIVAKGAGSIIRNGYLDVSHTDADITIGDTIKGTSGKFDITGGLSAVEGGTIQLKMTDGSKFVGQTSLETGGKINLDIAGASSQWQVMADSTVSHLNLENNAVVILGDSARHAGLDPATRVILTTDKLSGNGKFYLTVNATRDGLISNYDQEMGDRLVVTGEATGHHKIVADDKNTGGAAVVGSEVLRLVNVQNGTGTSNAVFELENGYVDIGAYKFDLKKEDAAAGAANWILSTRAGGTGGLPGLTNIAQHTAGILSTNYLLGHVETQTLLQRMGELRQGDSSGDVWGRVYTGKLSSFENKRLSSYGMDYNGMQIGVDRRLDASENATVYIGGVVGYGKGEVDYAIGSGQTDSYHVGAYGTYKADNGFYVDGIVKYSHMKNEVNTLTGGGYAVNGKGNTNGFSIGVEAGKRFYTSGKQQGFYVEPQGQLTFGQQNGATINSSNGLRTDLDSYTSILGRASVILGYDISQGKNPINVYFKTGYVKEFDGETSYTFNHFNKEKYDFDGGWWDNGIGVNVQLAERHHIYGEANYARGGSFDKKQVNVGYRYSF